VDGERPGSIRLGQPAADLSLQQELMGQCEMLVDLIGIDGRGKDVDSCCEQKDREEYKKRFRRPSEVQIRPPKERDYSKKTCARQKDWRDAEKEARHSEKEPVESSAHGKGFDGACLLEEGAAKSNARRNPEGTGHKGACRHSTRFFSKGLLELNEQGHSGQYGEQSNSAFHMRTQGVSFGELYFKGP